MNSLIYQEAHIQIYTIYYIHYIPQTQAFTGTYIDAHSYTYTFMFKYTVVPKMGKQKKIRFTPVKFFN